MIAPVNSKLTSRKKLKVEFDYEPQQWEAIIACANAKRPGKNLTDKERQSLLEAAIAYKRELELRQNPNYLSPNRIAQKWKRVSKLVQQLRCEVGGLQKHEEAIRALPSLFGLQRLTWQSKKGLRIREPADSERVLAVLEGWEWDTSRSLTGNTFIINQFRFGRREQDRAKRVFYRKILRVWVDMIGGSLGYSTSNRKRSGPSIRFVRAVAVPVMGEGAPKPETIADILNWEAKLRKRRSSGWLEVVMTY